MAASHPITVGVKFKHVEAFPGYGIDEDGTPWSCRRKGRITERWHRLRPHRLDCGHLQVMLRRDGRSFGRLVHCLVLEAFVGPCPPGMEGCHFPDRDPSNNRLGNLRWDTHVNNMRDMEIHGTRRRGERAGNARLTDAQAKEIRDLLGDGMSTRRVAARFGVSATTVRSIGHGQTWKHLEGASVVRMNPPGSTARGEESGAAKLSGHQVIEIRERHASGGISMGQLGREYGISVPSVHGILHRKTWRHL